MSEAEDDAGLCHRVVGLGRDDGVQSGICLFQFGASRFKKLQQIKSELVQREVGQRDAVVKVFEVEDFVLQSFQLPIAEQQVLGNEFFKLAVFQQVVRLGRGEVNERHACLHAMLDVQVTIQVRHGPEVD